MKTKFLLGFLLTAILLAMTVSAFSVSSDTIELSKTVKTINFTVTAGATLDVTVPDFPKIVDVSGNEIVITTSDIVGNDGIVPAGTIETITVSYSSLPVKLAIGDLPVVTSNLTDGTTKVVTLKFVNSFCDNGVKDTYTKDSKTYELDASIKDINVDGFGDEKDNEWFPLDDIEIELEFDNVGNENIDDILVEMCLYDESTNKCVVDEDDMELDDNFKLKDGDEKKLIATYKVDPDNIDEPGDYVLYMKAYSDELKEENLCLQDSEAITIVEDEFVLLDDVVIPDTVNCGGIVEVKADAWNIGDDDQEEVYLVVYNQDLVVYNQELGINKKVAIGDIDSWDKQDVSFSFDIPKDAEEKTYLVELRVFDENDDLFETENDDESVFNYNIKVEGNCAAAVAKKIDASISVDSDQEYKAIAGEEVTVKMKVENTGEEQAEFDIVVEDYEDWATGKTISPRTVELGVDQTKDVSITLDIDEKASGIVSFNVKVLSDKGEVLDEKVIELEVEEAGETAGITGATIAENIRANWFIWVIVIINIILIIAIIAVARRIAKSR